MKQKFNITGMSCASCASHVKNAVCKLDVMECNVNLLTNSMEVVFDETKLTDQNIIESVKNAGYGASVYQNELVKSHINKLKKSKLKLIISLVLLIVLMYVSMGKMVGLPIPNFLSNIIVNCTIQAVLSLAIILINFNYYISGSIKLFKLKPDMNTLVWIGSFTSFIYATINLINIYINSNNLEYIKSLHSNLYFDSAAMILVMVSIGKYLEEKCKKNATSSLDLLMELIPDVVSKKVGDNYEVVSINSVSIDDVIKINPYEIIPLDGFVIEGETQIDESSITGESLYKLKKENDSVISGTKNQSGTILVKVTKSSSDSTMNQIVKLVEKTSESKMPVERIVDKVASIFVPAIFGIAIIVFIAWFLINKNVSNALEMMISTLVVSCPCALGLATPMCITVSTLLCARKNILIKDATTFETISKIDVVMFDKTGTLTSGKMDIIESTLDENNMQILASLEQNSNHPLASVILKNFKGSLLNVDNFKVVNGKGITGQIEQTTYYAGSEKLVKDILNINVDLAQTGTHIYLFTQEKIIGYVVLQDTIKTSSKKVISLFKSQNIKTIMLTGDNELVAKEVANSLNIDECYSSLLPQDKAQIISEYSKEHKVLMVGDGINDSVALLAASVGVAMNETNIARASANVVLTTNEVLDVYNCYNIGRKTVKNIKLNLFWAFIYNVIMIPIAAGVLYNFGIKLNPMLCSICMSLSSICVCLNALRLNKIKLEENNYNMKFYVTDMMCPKCVAHIKNALNNNGIENVNIKLDDKSVTVESEKSIDEIFEIIKNAGYEPILK